MSILFTCGYCLLAGGAYASVTKRRFEESLAPAFFLQILLMLLTGMLFGSITAGILIGIIGSCAGWIVACRRRGQQKVWELITGSLGITSETGGGIIFILLFLFVYVINTGKYFNRWDEFSHWGIFIKECLRTDRLYCASPYHINHQDYVPAVTLFETLFSRLAFRYREADAFRAIQLLQLAVFLPLATLRTDERKDLARRSLTILFRMLFILGIPLLFDKINFYHSIYTDGTVAVLLFACMWIAHTERAGGYKIFALALSLSVLLQSKMLAVVFLPMVVIYAAVTDRTVFGAKMKQVFCGILLEGGIPVLFWWLYERYVQNNLTLGGGQSFAGHGISGVLRILAHDGSVPFQETVEQLYLRSLFTRGVIWKLPYVWAVLGIILFLTGIMRIRVHRGDRAGVLRIRWLALWCLIASVAYAAVMLYLYLTSFSEYEATILDNYERYMSSLMLAMVYFVPAVAFAEFSPSDSEAGRKQILILATLSLMIWTMAGIVREGGQLRQLLPGSINGEKPAFGREAEFLKEYISDDESVLMISRGDRGYYGNVLKYACWPIEALAVSPGPPAFEGDIWSVSWSEEDLSENLGRRDHLWIYHADEAFRDQYGIVLSSLSGPADGALYRIRQTGDGFEFIPEGVYTDTQ